MAFIWLSADSPFVESNMFLTKIRFAQTWNACSKSADAIALVLVLGVNYRQSLIIWKRESA